MNEVNAYNDDTRQYLQMMQDNITRMATNSSNAKTWVVTIVTALLAIGCSSSTLTQWLLLVLIPIVAFWYMDAFYLQLERKLRNREQFFINVLRGKETSEDDLSGLLYDFRPLHKDEDNEALRYVETGCQMLNKSVYPIYVSLFVITVVVACWGKIF